MAERTIGRNASCFCGSGRKFKHCCIHKSNGVGRQAYAFQHPLAVHGEGVALQRLNSHKGNGRNHHPPKTVIRVGVDFTFDEPFGKAEVGYSFPVRQRIVLASGHVLPVEDLAPGMRFKLEDGSIATVTGIQEPKVWGPPPSESDEGGNYARRVVGRVKRTGFVVMDVVFGGQVVTTTPGHQFWSVTRQAWIPAGQLRPGELLRNDQGGVMPVISVSRPRNGRIELHNLEVEQFHTYLVGTRERGAVLAHNGLECIPKPAQAAEEAAAAPAQRRTLYHYTTEKGQKGIVESNELWPSTKAANPKDARYGDGQYLSDIAPGTKTPGQLSKAFLNDPRGWRRFTHWVEIDVTGLPVVDGRSGVSVILNNGNLDLTGRIVGSGVVPKKP